MCITISAGVRNIQVTDFAKGEAMDAQITKLGLGGGGGGPASLPVHEAYQLAAYYFLNCCDCPKATTKPIMFITGDEFWSSFNALCSIITCAAMFIYWHPSS